MRTLTLNDDNYLIPGDWNELTAGNLLFLVYLLKKNITTEEMKLKMLLHSMRARVTRHNFPYFRVKAKKKKYELTSEELSVISDIFDYLFAEVKGKYSLNPLLVKNPFPVIRCGLTKLYGPADGLTDFTYQRFSDLLVYQTKIDQSEADFDNFLSILYRTKNGKESNKVSRISKKKKIVILWFYMGCLNFIQNKFPAVFSGVGDKPQDIFDSQMRVIDALAQNDVTKKEQVKNSLLYDAFYTMEVAAETMEKLNDNTFS